MDIETRNASIDLLSVTIRTLHVSGKQMTLAVFRQLPIADAYQPTGELAPIDYWGLVRYPIKDQGDIWLVASFDGRLYRCAIDLEHNVETEERNYALSAWRLRAHKNYHKALLNDTKNVYATIDFSDFSEGVKDIFSPKFYYTDSKEERANKLHIMAEDEEMCRSKIEIATNIESSNSILLELPQLFIAV